MSAGERNARQDAIRDLIATYEVTAQVELVELLAEAGIDVNQATVSRDLDQLGIGKLRGADGVIAYSLPDRSGLAQLLRQFVTLIDSSGNLAILRTPPGAAATVASAIDTSALPLVLATVQGDDTVLVVAREPADGHAVADRLRTIKAPPRRTAGDQPGVPVTG